jgi:hypothetical protein
MSEKSSGSSSKDSRKRRDIRKGIGNRRKSSKKVHEEVLPVRESKDYFMTNRQLDFDVSRADLASTKQDDPKKKSKQGDHDSSGGENDNCTSTKHPNKNGSNNISHTKLSFTSHDRSSSSCSSSGDDGDDGDDDLRHSTSPNTTSTKSDNDNGNQKEGSDSGDDSDHSFSYSYSTSNRNE